MKITLYYAFISTPDLVKAAEEAGNAWLVEPEIWSAVEHDRVDMKVPKESIEKAFWTIFRAKLANDAPETPAQIRFRARCLELGFVGCWRLTIIRGCGPLQELLDEADELIKKHDSGQ